VLTSAEVEIGGPPRRLEQPPPAAGDQRHDAASWREPKQQSPNTDGERPAQGLRHGHRAGACADDRNQSQPSNAAQTP